ncbi:CbaC protein [Halovivax limisalsi]|uniref:CbaC protein n=1 Tax=Halovivax limisalsi TaxID=1453760 RepID=UPI001FFDD1A7|nr:CbaC protein [Halovivax limisalsi]
MRTSPAKLLLVGALVLVFLVEGRTVLAFFGVEVTPTETVALGVVAFALLLGWAVWPGENGSA